MRFIGLILALGAIAWVLYQASGGEDAETVLSEGHQQALEKAEGVEETVMDATQKRMEALEEQDN